MQLDKRIDAAHQLAIRPDPPRINPRTSQRIRISNPTVIRQPPSPLSINCPSKQLATKTRQPKPSTFLLNKHHNSNRPHRQNPSLPQQIDSGKPRNDPQWPVKRSPVRDRVKMAAGNNHAAARGSA